MFKIREKLYSSLRRNISSGNYLPEVDGIRFLAIFLVVAFHVYGYFRHYSPYALDSGRIAYNFIHRILRDGDKGVPLFFSLSGFILALPFGEHIFRNAHPVRLRKFFSRRLTRLEPPYIIALSGLFLSGLILSQVSFQQLLPSFVASLFYSHNVIFGAPIISVVAWSLELEIQFYLLVPLLVKVFFLKAFYRKLIMLVFMIGLPLLRSYFPLPFISLYDYFEYFCAGMLIADIYLNDRNIFDLKIISSLLPVLGTFIFVTIILLDHDNYIINRMIFPLIVTSFYLIILTNEFWKKLFSLRVVSTIGGMCYSIYLLHFAIISFFGRYTINFQFTGDYMLNYLFQFFIISIPVLAISTAYYVLIERPCMNPNWPSKFKEYVNTLLVKMRLSKPLKA